MPSVVVRKNRHHQHRRQSVVTQTAFSSRLLLCLLGVVLLLSSSSTVVDVVVVVVEAQETAETPCGLWLGPSPIKEANDHGWGHSIFTGKFIKKGQIVLGSGIIEGSIGDGDDQHGEGKDFVYDETNKDHRVNRDRSEKVFGDIMIPVYDWQALDMGQEPEGEEHDYMDDDDGTRLHPSTKKEVEEKKEEDDKNNSLSFIDDDPPLFQQLWNGDYYHEQIMESFDSMRVFVPGLSNISPCAQNHFNLQQAQKVTYRDWRSIHGESHDTSKPSHQSGAFSYWSNQMFVADRDIQPGEELVVECADNSDRFDPDDYPPVKFAPKEAGGYSICLDDKIEERLADHTPNVCSKSPSTNNNNDNKEEEGMNGGGQRGLFAKRTLEKDTVLTSSPMVPVHKNEMLMNRTTDNMGDDTETIHRKQLLLNYCYGHPESSLLWLPTASLLHGINHATTLPASMMDSQTKKIVQPNARIAWHHDEYNEPSHMTSNITRRQRFHHLELLEMSSLTVVKQQGMGLMMDLIATRRIYEDEEILIDYGKGFTNKWIEHQKEWDVELDRITKQHLDDKKDHKAERQKEHQLKKELHELQMKNPNSSLDDLSVEHHHRHKEIVNALTVKPLGSYVTASDYNEMHSTDVIETITEQHRSRTAAHTAHKQKQKDKTAGTTDTAPFSPPVYPSNIQTACYFGTDWLYDDINEDVNAETTTYMSWYKQDDHFEYCLLPCLITERREYVEDEAKRIRRTGDDIHDDDDDVYDDDDVDGDGAFDDDDYVDSNEEAKRNEHKLYHDSNFKQRYTAKLIDHYEENTSIDYDCHLYKRFDYIYEDIPREGIIFVNKPHSTDVWLEKAFREPIGLPDDMVPDIWKDLSPKVHAAATVAKTKKEEGGGMRGGSKNKKKNNPNVISSLSALTIPVTVNKYLHPDVIKAMWENDIVDEEYYKGTMIRWTETETRRDRLEELESKTDVSAYSSYLGLQDL